MKNNNVKKLVEISLLIALEVILTRFCSINTAILRIGFGFLPIAIIAMMHGPLSAGVAYAIGDLSGMMIFPSGSYFPGFTLTAFLTGELRISIIQKTKNLAKNNTSSLYSLFRNEFMFRHSMASYINGTRIFSIVANTYI